MFFNRGNIEGIISSKIVCMMFVHVCFVLFDIYVKANFVDIPCIFFFFFTGFRAIASTRLVLALLRQTIRGPRRQRCTGADARIAGGPPSRGDTGLLPSHFGDVSDACSDSYCT